jgi:hypothetical protein
VIYLETYGQILNTSINPPKQNAFRDIYLPNAIPMRLHIIRQRQRKKLDVAVQPNSGHIAQKLCLENEFAFLVLLRAFIGLVVLPAHSLLALPAHDVADDMSSRRDITFVGLSGLDVLDAVE